MDDARDPLADLERVAFLLERGLESSHRVQAFRGALAALRPLADDEVRARAVAGTLTDLRGVGPKTAGVVVQALEGRVPDYLQRLEDDVAAEPPLDDAAQALRSATRGDCHTHSDWSDGGSPPHVMARTAAGLGHEWVALTDHSPRLRVANGLSRERLLAQLDLLEEVNAELAPFRVLSGIECDVLPDGSLDQDDDLLERLDVVVASVHSELRMPSEPMTERMVTAVADPLVDVLGHCTGRNVLPRGRSGKVRPPSEFDAEVVVEACRVYGTALEVNSRPERQDPPDEILDLALEAGVLLAVDTDAHAPGQLDWQASGPGAGCVRLAARGADPDRVVTTWTADRLTTWTHDHG